MKKTEPFETTTTSERPVDIVCDRCGRTTDRLAELRDANGRITVTRNPAGGEGTTEQIEHPPDFVYAEVSFPHEMAIRAIRLGVIDAQLCEACTRDLVDWVGEGSGPGISEGQVELMGS